MFGFTCVPSCKPNKFRLSGVLSQPIWTMFGFTCSLRAFMFGLHVHFDALSRSTARALIRTSLGLLERSDTSEKPSKQNLAGPALFLPQGGTHFQLVPLGSPQGYFMGKFSPLTSIKFLPPMPPIKKWSKLFAPEKIEETWNNWLSTHYYYTRPSK